MDNKKKSLIFLVDDDQLFLKTLEADFKNNTEISVRTFATGELCLENISEDPDVIVLDYYLNGVDEKARNGIETLDKINAVKSSYSGYYVILAGQH